MSCFPSPPETSNKIFTKRNERLAVASNKGIWTSIGLAESGWFTSGKPQVVHPAGFLGVDPTVDGLRENQWRERYFIPLCIQGFEIPRWCFFQKNNHSRAKSRSRIFGFLRFRAWCKFPKIWTPEWWWQLIVILIPWDPSHPSKNHQQKTQNASIVSR